MPKLQYYVYCNNPVHILYLHEHLRKLIYGRLILTKNTKCGGGVEVGDDQPEQVNAHSDAAPFIPLVTSAERLSDNLITWVCAWITRMLL